MSVVVIVLVVSVAVNDGMYCGGPLEGTLMSSSPGLRLPLPSAVNAPVVTYQEPGAVCCPKNWKA